MRNRLLSAVAVLALTGGAALGQANIRPDPTPRLPPQAGQGLPLEDRQFLERAVNLSEAEVEAGKLAAEKSANPALKEFGQLMAAEHGKLRQSVEGMARQNGIAVQPHASRGWWTEELRRIGGLTGQEFDREYLRWQLQAHLAMADLYQTQASHSTQTELSKLAITTLNQVQRHFDQAKRLGGQVGVTIDTVKQPPQY
jgi:predicted outer membrane protein